VNPARRSISACGTKRLFATVGSPVPLASTCSPPPFALSLSKGRAELAEAPGVWHEGFDKLSPNGSERGFDKLSPNGSLRTLKFRNGPQGNA
jgi:hypothetical protein